MYGCKNLSCFGFLRRLCVVEKNRKCLNVRWVFALLPTDGAKNSAGFGTLLFLLTVNFINWFMFHFTVLPALFLACVVWRIFTNLLLQHFCRFPFSFLQLSLLYQFLNRNKTFEILFYSEYIIVIHLNRLLICSPLHL